MKRSTVLAVATVGGLMLVPAATAQALNVYAATSLTKVLPEITGTLGADVRGLTVTVYGRVV